jgi:mRNA interferase RelE/StbE
MPYMVVLGPGAEREFRKLDPGTQAQIARSLEKLATSPKPMGVQAISQHPGFWRLRTGNYRVIYTIGEEEREILVVVVRHRREAYRDLGILEQRLRATLARRGGPS